MKLFEKVKSFFSKKEEKVEEALEIPQIKAEKPLEEVCAVCHGNIAQDEKTRKLNQFMLHKRCFKRVKKEMLAGKSFEEIMKGGIT